MIKNVSVIGAGTMGNGIAHVFAQNNFEVNFVDANAAQLEKSLQTISKNLNRQLIKNQITEEKKKETLINISCFTDISEGVNNADLVIEAATENVDIKLKIFKQLDEAAPASAILATNTSSISITKIAAVTKRPEKVIGMHFMNPVPVTKLVEIINGFSTDAAVTKIISDITKQLGKISCVVDDYPGFIANRILMPMINEAIYSLYEGIAGVEEIDMIMKLGMSHPMGPLQLADFIGLDICLSILNVMSEGFGNSKYAACPLLIKMVTAGCLGIKTNEGFYTYTPGSKELIISSKFKKA